MPTRPTKNRFTLDVIRARKGDCLLLHYGTATKPRLVIIDGGPSGVYQPHLRPRLQALRATRKLAATQALPVDVLLVSHVDDDHIKGVLELTAELREQVGDREPVFLKVGSLWHNSFDDLLDTTPDQLEVEASWGAAAVNGKVDIPEGTDPDVAKVLASIGQGRDLRNDAEFLKWKPNAPFKGLIMAVKGAKPVALGNLKVRVIGPMREELKALQKAHDEFVASQAKKKPGAVTAAFVDESIPNLSSIVLLVECGAKRMLLTGDARGDKILEGLEMAGVLKKGGSMHVDVLKVPHHGSANNMAAVFFERVTADQYVFSGDGQHGNPERETLEMLFAARGSAPFTLHFTYPIDEIDVERRKEWDAQNARAKKRGKSRAPWSPSTNSLTAFFKKTGLAAGQSIAVAREDAPHLIELLAPL